MIIEIFVDTLFLRHLTKFKVSSSKFDTVMSSYNTVKKYKGMLIVQKRHIVHSGHKCIAEAV